MFTHVHELQWELALDMGKRVTCDTDAAGFGDALNACGDVHPIAIDTLLIVDDVARIYPHAIAHLTFCRNAGIALSHHLLEGNRALDCVHNAGELSKDDAIASSANDAAKVLGDHRRNDCLVRFEVPDGCFLAGSHQRAIAAMSAARIAANLRFRWSLP